MSVATLALAKVLKAPAARSRRRLVRMCAVALVVLAGLAVVPVATATELPVCTEAISVPEGATPEVVQLVGVRNAIVAECEASNVRLEVAQSVAHDDAWLLIGIVGATIVAAAFFKVALR